MNPSEEDILHTLETHDREQTEGVRQMLLAEGRPDLVADLDRRLHDIETGVHGARSCWHALSEAQRRALRFTADSKGKLIRYGKNSFIASWWAAAPPKPIRVPTIRNLIARELLACDGGAFDPEKTVVLTERGRFVLEFGEK